MTLNLLEKQNKKLEVFITIDDLHQQALQLVDSIQQLQDYKYPLDVRKGCRKEENDMSEEQNISSRMLKAGKKTYFFDIRETKDKKPYLLITESWFKDDQNKEPDRNNIAVFPEQAKDFALAVAVMLDQILQD